MRRPRGWTLAEAVVAVALAAAVLVVAAQVLSTTSRKTRVQVQRNLQHTRMQAAAGLVEKTLLGCASDGVSWYSDTGGAVLATHTQQSGNVVNVPRWEPFWRCFVWVASNGQLYLVQWPPAGGTPVPPQTRPQAMTAAQMVPLLAQMVASPGSGRVIAGRVTNFRYALDPGPLFHVEIEVDVPEFENREGWSSNRLKTVRLIHPRL